MPRSAALPTALLTALLTAAPAQALDVTARVADSGRTVVLARGDALRVSLQENPSTGFGWRTIRAPDKAVLRLRSNRFVGPPSQGAPAPPGAPGRREVSFVAVGRGTTSVTLRLRAPDGASARVFRLRVEVR